jgi:hypothetical protein
MVLQFEFLIFDEMRDTLHHDHFVWAILEQDLLILECNDFLGTRRSSCSSIRKNIISQNPEIKVFW